MSHRSIYIDSLAAWAFWITGGLLTISDSVGLTPNGTGSVGVAIIAGAHLLCVRRTVDEMEAREREAFEFGHETGLRGLPRQH